MTETDSGESRRVDAALLLAPTLAGVASARPAFATGTVNDEGSRLGNSWISIDHDASSDPNCQTPGWSDFYSATVTPSWDPTFADATPDYHFGPGSSVTLHFAWDTTGQQYGSCAGYSATSATVVLRYSTGGQVGSTSWPGDVTISGTTGNATATMHFDNNAFDTVNRGAEKIGQFYVGIVLHGNADANASTEGGLPAGVTYDTAPVSWYQKGIFTTGYMTGMADTSKSRLQTDQGSTGVGKDFSLTRIFGGDWSLPGVHGDGGSVDKYMAIGMEPIWTINPEGTNFTVDGTDSRWQTVADGDMDSGTNGLTNILAGLNSLGAYYKVPVIFAIRHEPHDNVTGSGKCTIGGSNPCEGTATDFKNMYAHVHSLLTASLPSTYPWVRLAYIAVDTNMIGTDNLRPANGDYDLLGPDLYNYYRWKQGCTGGAGSGCTASTQAYKYATDNGGGLGDATHGLIQLAISEKKHIVIPEMGTHPGCPGGGLGNTDGTFGHCNVGDSSGTRDQWFQDLADKLTSNADYETWFIGWAYFNKTATYDWQVINDTTNANNNDLSCPTPSGSNNCWDGDNNAATGWKDSFTNDSTHNHSHSAWFVGTSSASSTFMP